LLVEIKSNRASSNIMPPVCIIDNDDDKKTLK